MRQEGDHERGRDRKGGTGRTTRNLKQDSMCSSKCITIIGVACFSCNKHSLHFFEKWIL